MRGWAWFYRSVSVENRKKAWRAFEEALQINAKSVEARIGLAMILVTNVAVHWSACVSQDEEHAERLLLEALERDPNRSMGNIRWGSFGGCRAG